MSSGPRDWARFEADAPDLAGLARELLERWGFVLAGTIRRDGTPRISPVEAHFVDGDLMLVMEDGTLKARDLLRDPRVVLNAPVVDAHDPGAELKLRGRAVAVTDEAQRRAAAETVERRSGWRPPPRWHVFAIELDDVAHIAWREGEMTMTRWRRGRAVERRTRRISLD